MVENFKTAGIDYGHGPEKGVEFQCFSELLSAYKATMVRNEQCDGIKFREKPRNGMIRPKVDRNMTLTAKTCWTDGK